MRLRLTIQLSVASNASRGAAAKLKTKKWLVNRGYVVADMEVVRTIFISPTKRFAQKFDQFGADLLAMGHDTTVLVQVKSGESARGGTFPAARREFEKFPHPSLVRKIVIAWPPSARVPRLVEVFADKSFTEVQAI